MKRVTSFDPISGLTGVLRPDGQELVLSGPEVAINRAKAFLTAEDASIKYQIKRLKDKKVKSEAEARWVTAEIDRLKPQALVHYFAQQADGSLSCPPGFWWLAEECSGHKNTEIKMHPLPEGYGKTLRPYQVEAVQALLQHKRAMLEVATGLGKTALTVSLCHSAIKSGKRPLVVVPTIDLVEQTVKELRQAIPGTCGIGGTYKFKEGAPCAVTTIASAKGYSDMFNVIIADECFPSDHHVWTEFGWQSFAQLELAKTLPRVWAWDETTKKFELRQVQKVIKKPAPEKMCKIFFSRLQLTCTEDHKFLSTSGRWIRAKELLTGERIVAKQVETFASTAQIELKGDLLQLAIGSFLGDGTFTEHKGKLRCKFTHGVAQKNYAEWKLNCFGAKGRLVEKNGYAQTQAWAGSTKLFFTSQCCPIPPGKKSKVPSWIAKEIGPLGFSIWFMDDGCVDHKARQIQIHTETFTDDSETQLTEICQKFGLHPKFRTNTRSDGRRFTYLSFGVADYQKIMDLVEPYCHPDLSYKTRKTILDPYLVNKNGIAALHVEKVESVIWSDIYNKKKQTNYLYDLTVADDHNYVVTSRNKGKCGAVAHNCHLGGADTYSAAVLLSGATHAYGLTATPVRADDLVLGIHALCGPVVYSRDARWGIENGFLAPVSVFIMKVPSGRGPMPEAIMQAVAYRKLCEGQRVLTLASDTLRGMEERGLKTLVLFKTKEPGETFARFHNERFGTKHMVAHSSFRNPFRQFKDGKTNVLISNSALLGTGVDVPSIDALISVVNSSGEAITRQVLGRGLRPSPGKKRLYFFDVVLMGYGYKDKFDGYSHLRQKIYLDVTDDLKVITV